jgi:hypothetical protein
LAKKIVFQSAVVLSCKRDLSKATAQLSSSLTGPVASAMGWTDIPECATGANLDGELGATLLEISPKDKELSKHGFQLKVSKVYDFEVVRLELEGKSGKGHRQELRFKAAISDEQGMRKIEAYQLTIGEGKGSCTVHYEPQPIQAELPGTADDQQELPETE